MSRFWRENGLSIVLFVLFAAFLGAQSYVGMLEENSELAEHGQTPVTYLEYVTSGGFVEATMENWESEFLQMWVYVIFTVFLFQKGSSESKPLNNDDPVNRDPRRFKNKRRVPWPVRRGGFALRIYENSLSVAFFLLFALSFVLHALGGAADYNEERILHGEPPVTVLEYLSGSRFWFESFQNWQSEFLAIWAMVVFSIFLRQRGSPESKPVDAPHFQTGAD
jgi:hypothetical protein